MARRQESITQKAAASSSAGATPSSPPPPTSETGDSEERETEPGAATEPTDAVDDPMVGSYETLFELARGGMGTVYVARRLGAHGFDRLVALKRLDVRGERDPVDVEAFLREARLTARINHPNVVQTQELFEDERSPVMVMDLIQGVSLAKLLARVAEADEVLDADVAGYITLQIAKGLHAAHELTGADGESLGLVHRDVSPQNILVSTEGRVYVADFGIAKLAEGERATQSGVVKGKFGYMAPEQTRAETLDRRADVFGLGIVLHEMLTGKRLFDGPSPAAIILQINSEEVCDPRRIRPEIPEVWAELSLACLTRDRSDRVASAMRVADLARDRLRERRRVDDSDVAELVVRFAASDLARLHAQLQRCDSGRKQTSHSKDQPRASDAERVEGTVTRAVSTGGAARPRSAMPGWLGAGIIILLLGGAVWLSMRQSGGGDPGVGDEPAQARDPVSDSPQPAVEPVAPTPTAPSAAAIPSAPTSALPAPVEASAAPVRPTWRPPPAAPVAPTAVAPSATALTPRPGEPFPTLR